MKKLLTSAVLFLYCNATSFAQFSGSGAENRERHFFLMKRLLSFVVLYLFSLTVLSADFTVDGINYNITSTEESTVEITNGIYEGKIVIPETVEWNGNEYSVTRIGDFTFNPNSSGLTSITIPNSVTSIGKYNFDGCEKLTEIISLITEPFPYERSGTYPIISLYVPVGTKELYDKYVWRSFPVYEWGKNFTSGGFDYNIISMDKKTVEITERDPFYRNECYYKGDIVIPETVEWNGNEYSVTRIGDKAFGGSREMASITIPSSVTSIGEQAFSQCNGLTSITIPNSVTTIGDYGFYNCINLESIVIPNSVTSIGHDVLSFCTSLTSVTISNTLTNISMNAFWGCSSLTSITIPNSVTSIDYNAFMDCSSLSSISIPKSVTSIKSGVFSGCSGLTSIIVEDGNNVYDSRDNCNAIIETEKNELITGCMNTIIPNTVTSIGKSAFDDCTGLTSIAIPNSVTSIGSAFAHCSSLSSISIPKSVTSINSGAFWGCSGLTSIIVEDGNKVYDSRDNCNAIIETEKNELIRGCMNTIIPNTVTSIREYAFIGCTGLTSIAIPNSVTSIGECAFYGCTGLTEIILFVSEPFPISNSVWHSVKSSEIPLYVPAGTKKLYEATEGWNVFTNIIERGISVAVDGSGVDYANNPDMNQDTNLNGNVVGNIFYNISDGNGEYSSAEGCIILRKTTSDEQVDNMDGLDLFGEDVKNNYTGIIFMVQQGSGAVKVNAETTGSMTLKVKVGKCQPVEMVLSGKLEVTVPYTVSEPSYVYIYGGEKSTANARRTTANTSTGNALKIYGIEWSKQDISTIINPICEKDFFSTPVYNLNGQLVKRGNDNSCLPRGLYIMNGQKVVIK